MSDSSPLSEPRVDLNATDRYLAGESSPQEAAAFQRALSADVELERALAILQAIPILPEGRPQSVSAGLAEAGWRAHRKRMNGLGSGRIRRSVFRPWQGISLGIAALAFICVMGAVVLRSRSHRTQGAVTTYVTNRGQRANIVLPDGTRIVLNVASRVDVPRDFGEGSRVVRLQGEAYFDVAHTTEHPFTVEAAGVRTTVLGTEFGVQAYRPTDFQVAVRSGKIAVNHVVLTANDVAHLSSTGRVLVAQHQPVDALLAFTTGRLVVANRPLREAIDALDRWYDVDIRLGDPSLGDVKLDAVLVSGSIGDLMEELGNALEVRVERHGQTLTLYPR